MSPNEEPNSSRRLWMLVVLALVVTGMGVATWTTSRRQSVLERAFMGCREQVGTMPDFIVLAEGGDSITISGPTREIIDAASADESGEIFDAVNCIIKDVAPAAVAEDIGSTTRQEGNRHAAWEDYEATWSFNPDTGLDLVVMNTNG